MRKRIESSQGWMQLMFVPVKHWKRKYSCLSFQVVSSVVSNAQTDACQTKTSHRKWVDRKCEIFVLVPKKSLLLSLSLCHCSSISVSILCETYTACTLHNWCKISMSLADWPVCLMTWFNIYQYLFDNKSNSNTKLMDMFKQKCIHIYTFAHIIYA